VISRTGYVGQWMSLDSESPDVVSQQFSLFLTFYTKDNVAATWDNRI